MESILESIFEARADELAILNEKDKSFMKQDKSDRSKNENYLNKELQKIPYNLNCLKESITKIIDDYVDAIDFEAGYFYKKYYLAGLKDGMKLNKELR
ncbi:MAG: hypothetical protein HFJ54_02620 [Clostridia bacterium]|nr:hypothetical protein [Clostridia bacterium]